MGAWREMILKQIKDILRVVHIVHNYLAVHYKNIKNKGFQC